MSECQPLLDDVSPPEFVIRKRSQLLRLARSHGLDYQVREWVCTALDGERLAKTRDPSARGDEQAA